MAKRVDNDRTIIIFFILFISVYFLESIGGFFMNSSMVSIEKQFQISSRMSGLMVAASDFGYIPSVVFVSYVGGKGNRAKWIAGGCLMIASADILISMSNFLFPVDVVELTARSIEESFNGDIERLSSNEITEAHAVFIQEKGFSIESKFLSNYPNVSMTKTIIEQEFLNCVANGNAMNKLRGCNQLIEYVRARSYYNSTEIPLIRMLSASPFSLCSKLLNTLKSKISNIKCTANKSNYGPFFTIFIGLIILGVGRTMPFSLGLPLIDDNVRGKNLPLYFAGMFFIRVLGPMIGLMAGSITNRYYYSFTVPPGLSPRDPMWIGRWWAGFLTIGLSMIIPSLALFRFADVQEKISATKDKNNRREEKAEDEDGCMDAMLEHRGRRRSSLALLDRNLNKDDKGNILVPSTLCEKIHDFVKTLKELGESKVYVGLMIGRILEVISFRGYFVFLPKYLQIQFNVSQHRINYLIAIAGVCGFAIGVFTGSAIMRKFKLQGRKAASFVAICSALAAIISFVNAAVGCESALSHIGDQSMDNAGIFMNDCNLACNCSKSTLYPVCNSRGQSFYSPCYAGCNIDLNLANEDQEKVFQNCRCANTTDGTVSREFCNNEECESKLILYIINLSIGGFLGGLGVIPGMLMFLRSVPPIDRSTSLGFQGFVVSLFATLPSPVLWGWIIDQSCIIWNTACGVSGSGACALYKTDRLRLQLHIIYGIMRIISLTADLYVVYFAKDLVLVPEEKKEQEENAI